MTTFDKLWTGICMSVVGFYLLSLAVAVMRGETFDDHTDEDDE